MKVTGCRACPAECGVTGEALSEVEVLRVSGFAFRVPRFSKILTFAFCTLNF
jgi:hypothetical protein